MAIIAPNIPTMYEAHFGLPLCGAVLNAINTRPDTDTIAFIFEHGEAKTLLADTAFYKSVAKAIQRLTGIF